MKKYLRYIHLLVFISVVFCFRGQDVALKTNLLGDAALSPNAAVELALSQKFTVDVSGQMNAWKINGHSWKHWVVQTELRYWFCQKFGGHFVGLHLLGGQYNVGNIGIKARNFLGTDFSKLKNQRYQGWGAGAGIAYGYAFPLARHWNLELEAGFGWVYTRSDVYPCERCGTKIQKGKVHNYVGPTKAAINLEYVF